MPPQQVNLPPVQQVPTPAPLQHGWNKYAFIALGTFILSFLINPWLNPIARNFGGGLVMSLVSIVLPLLTLFFAIKAIRGVRKTGEKGKALSWIVLVLNLPTLFFAIVSAVLFLTVASFSTNFGLTNSNSNENNNIPLANENVETVGPTLESSRENYKRQAPYNNNVNFYTTQSGDAVGDSTGGGNYYYIQNNSVHGPIVATKSTQGYETDEHFFGRMESMGWPVGMRSAPELERSDSKSGHSFESVPTGPELNCFDTQTPSQSSLMYDGKQVGLHSILDGKCQSPVEGVLLSNDGLHYAYLVRAKRGFFAVVDGRKSNTYPAMHNLHFEGDLFVFNAITSDFTNFVRVKITTN